MSGVPSRSNSAKERGDVYHGVEENRMLIFGGSNDG